ncbi:MAG: hypothetical protein PHO37_09925 [Kiritimatiellae bacterium]|nr:hypothetical protein [Kiritimatiellia bacterium]
MEKRKKPTLKRGQVVVLDLNEFRSALVLCQGQVVVLNSNEEKHPCVSSEKVYLRRIVGVERSRGSQKLGRVRKNKPVFIGSKGVSGE